MPGMNSYVVFFLLIILFSGYTVGGQLLPNVENLDGISPVPEDDTPNLPTCCELFTSNNNSKYLKYLLIFGGIFAVACGLLLTFSEKSQVCSVDIFALRDKMLKSNEEEEEKLPELHDQTISPIEQTQPRKPRRKSRARSCHV